MLRHLRYAYDLARNHQFDPSLEFNLCAVIVRGGRVLSTGFNSRGWNPLSEHYRMNDYACTIHAEVDAIMSGRKKIRFEGSKVYVVRVKSDGTVGNAKPCEMCQHVLFNYGIKRVYHTTDEFPYVGSFKLKNPAER